MDFYNVHTHTFSTAENEFSIENKYPNATNFSKPFSIGIHPWFIVEEKIEEELTFTEEKLQKSTCFALGECGLDKNCLVDFELQKKVFSAQIQLAEKYKKPVIVHCVKAFQEIIELKKQHKAKQPYILHGFQKNLHVAQRLLKNNFYLSFGASVLTNTKLTAVLAAIPMASILVETDAHTVSISEIYTKIAAIKKIEVVALQQKIQTNFKTIFKK